MGNEDCMSVTLPTLAVVASYYATTVRLNIWMLRTVLRLLVETDVVF